MTIIWTISVMSVLTFVEANARLEYDKLAWGSNLNTEPYWTFYKLPVSKCYDECFKRHKCKTFSYHSVKKICNLFTFDSTTKNVITAPGYVLSEKRHWTEKSPDDIHCLQCDDVCTAPTYATSGMPVTYFGCQTFGCKAPINMDPLTHIEGNIFTIGAKLKHVCNDDEDKYRISECLSTGVWSDPMLNCAPPVVCDSLPDVLGGTFETPNGNVLGAIGTAICYNANDIIDVNVTNCVETSQWSIMEFTCLTRVQDLHAETRMIVAESIGEWWHNDGSNDKKISTRYQTTDSSVLFNFFYYSSDGAYKIRNNGISVCDGSQEGWRSLHTSSCHSSAYQRFYIYFNPRTSYYRIISKESGRVVRIDENQFVTTIENLPDSRSEFKFN